MTKFFLKFGLSFFQGYFFHTTMREGGIRKCSERGAIMDKFFEVIILVVLQTMIQPRLRTKLKSIF
jgi:hypothetical protein